MKLKILLKTISPSGDINILRWKGTKYIRLAWLPLQTQVFLLVIVEDSGAWPWPCSASITTLRAEMLPGTCGQCRQGEARKCKLRQQGVDSEGHLVSPRAILSIVRNGFKIF